MDDEGFRDKVRGLDEILARTAALGFSMASEPKTGALLSTLAASKPGGRLLELGTGTGVATAWILHGMNPEARLVTVDIDREAQQVAREVLGGDPRVEFVLSDGNHFLAEPRSGSFDLIFADAMPGKYESLNAALRWLSPGGMYVIDDLLPQPNWPEGHAAKVEPLLAELESRSDLVVTRMAWASGIAIATRR